MRVGIVTSPRGAAVRDVLATLRRRWPSLPVIVYPALVQGDGAARDIAEAIATANRRAEVDVLIVCRGGGSLEDLWAFNEEAVARAVHGSALPIVSGVGHETDVTICDLVADVRAATPTAAATLVVPDIAEHRHRAGQLARRLARAADHALARRAQSLDGVARRLVHPSARLEAQRARLADLAVRLARGAARAVREREAALSACRVRLLRELRAPLPQHPLVAALRDTLVRAGRDRLRRDTLACRVARPQPRAPRSRARTRARLRDRGSSKVARWSRMRPGSHPAMRSRSRWRAAPPTPPSPRRESRVRPPRVRLDVGSDPNF